MDVTKWRNLRHGRGRRGVLLGGCPRWASVTDPQAPATQATLNVFAGSYEFTLEVNVNTTQATATLDESILAPVAAESWRTSGWPKREGLSGPAELRTHD